MNIYQKLVGFIFFLSFGMRTALTCFSLDKLITTIGSKELSLYFSISATISIISILIFSFLSKWLSRLIRFILLHFILLFSSLFCFFSGQEALVAKVSFLNMVGFGLMIYFSNWSLSSIFISPFETKRIFPILGIFTQGGMIFGSILALLSYFGLSKNIFIPFWVTVEIFILVISIFLIFGEKKQTIVSVDPGPSKRKASLMSSFFQYKLIPKLALWIFLWGFLFTSMKSLTGKSFESAQINLTALYGSIDLIAALLSTILLRWIYPNILKKYQLGTMLLISSIILFAFGGIFISYQSFHFGVLAFLAFKLLEESFITMSISTKFSLYRSQSRDRLRLLTEIMARSLGGAMIALLFLLPSTYVNIVLITILCVMIILGLKTRKNFNVEVLNFLAGHQPEEKNNAVALFDRVQNRSECKKIIYLLENTKDVPLKINILNTFSNLKTDTPAPVVLDLILNEKNPTVQMAMLKYLDQVDFSKLDPFLNFKLTENLKFICSSMHSNVLRSIAMRVLIQKSPARETVEFVVKALSDEDDRVIANAIDGLNYVDYPGIVDVLLPFLNHDISRIKANTVVALWKYKSFRLQVKKTLNQMLDGQNHNHLISGIYAVGEVKDWSKIEFLKDQFERGDKNVKRGALVALLKLDCLDYVDQIVEIILSDDEGQAINTCYLSLRIREDILNEYIIAEIYKKGEDARQLAFKRYSKCGGFCRDQLNLLEGKIIETIYIKPWSF